MSLPTQSDVGRQIEKMHNKKIWETATYKETERALGHQHPESVPSVKAAAFKMLDDEIQRMKDEKRKMREWLERGAAEAERVSSLLPRLSEQLHWAKLRENEVREEVREKRECHNQLQLALHKANMELRSLQHQISMEENANAAEKAENNTKRMEDSSLREELMVVSKTIEKLKCEAAMVETAETAMECLAACSRRSLHELGKLGIAVNHTDLKNGLEKHEKDTDSFDSEDEADNTRHPPLVLAATKAMIDRCDSCLCTIWSGLSRLSFDGAHNRHQKDLYFEEAYLAVQRDFDTTVEGCTQHLKQLRDEVERWRSKHRLFENLVSELKETSEHNVDSHSPLGESSDECLYSFGEKCDNTTVSVSNITKRNNLRLMEDCRQLKMVNESLQEKCGVAASDYKSVKELKHAYRDLELKKAELAHVNEQLRKENRMMKLHTWVDEAEIPLKVAGR